LDGFGIRLFSEKKNRSVGSGIKGDARQPWKVSALIPKDRYKYGTYKKIRQGPDGRGRSAVIASWKDLVYTLAEMRKLQSDPKTRKSDGKLFLLNRLEREVDACVEKKMAELGLRQPELTLQEGEEKKRD
jgi:hypothetical protein